jgi:hypothetical protein
LGKTSKKLKRIDGTIIAVLPVAPTLYGAVTLPTSYHRDIEEIYDVTSRPIIPGVEGSARPPK